MGTSTRAAGNIRILPLGNDIEEDVLTIIAANLQALFSLPVDVLSAASLPESAYHPVRRQYNAISILRDLRAGNDSNDVRLLGVVNVDLFIPILTYVFGEAQMEQSCAVVSLQRIRYRKDGANAPLSLYLERAAKLAVHEVAHTFGLPHCTEADCIMKFLPDLDALDDQPLVLCRYCALEISERTDRR